MEEILVHVFVSSDWGPETAWARAYPPRRDPAGRQEAVPDGRLQRDDDPQDRLDYVGVSAPTLYVYFQDKDAIMLALCDQTFAHLTESIDRIREDSRPARSGSALWRGLCPVRSCHPDGYRLVFMSGHVPEAIRHTGHRGDTSNPDLPGARGAIIFARLVATLSRRRQRDRGRRLSARYLRRIMLDGRARGGFRADQQTRLSLVRLQVLIRGMLDAHMRGVVRKG